MVDRPLGLTIGGPAFSSVAFAKNITLERRTDCHNIGEDWHRLTPTARRHAPRLFHLTVDWSSWTMGSLTYTSVCLAQNHECVGIQWE